MMPMFDDTLANTGFLRVEFLSSGVVVVAVFVTSLLVGPALWLILSRRRRRWMWFLSPALSVAIAALLIVTGQGALSSASAEAMGTAVSTGWSTSGEFGMGVIPDQADLELGHSGQVWASDPTVTVKGSGDDRRADQRLDTNEFGYVGVGVIDVADGPLISVEAVPSTEGRVEVTVTNHSDLDLSPARVSGFTRIRDFVDVPAGESRRLEFETDEDLQAFGGQLFPAAGDEGMNCGFNFCVSGDQGPFGRIMPMSRSQRGRIEVRGQLRGDLDVAGNKHSSTVFVVARAAVGAPRSADVDAGPSVRIDAVGPNPNRQMFEGLLGPAPATETTIEFAPVGPPTTQASPELGGTGALPQEEATGFALLSTPVDQPALRCSVHTIVNSIEEWRDGTWARLEPATAPAPDSHFVAPNEARTFRFSPLAAGETRFLRFKTGLVVSIPSAISCVGVA